MEKGETGGVNVYARHALQYLLLLPTMPLAKNHVGQPSTLLFTLKKNKQTNNFLGHARERLPPRIRLTLQTQFCCFLLTEEGIERC